ncbi:hypothetical protein JCM10914A_42520 [Paenibacillus sp. JCM 10914]|uniref:hypothetical protein n=1 Tax=Paenibacillus sp. JCM 10914 TaxID=1236974 RepID=UPI0003CC3086|nr:hypothetical protein [Paenibacillus sp. JCM 10914]GAE05469.1 hypothetical protein JCM10914_1572 [Paenibacillus sp. JCM 10914]
MSIFRLDAAEYGQIDARYIQAVDLVITNAGPDEFDVLIHGYSPHGVYHVGLVHVAPGLTSVIPNITNHNQPFSLLLVTNINYSYTTLITLHAKNQGQIVAMYSQADFQTLE